MRVSSWLALALMGAGASCGTGDAAPAAPPPLALSGVIEGFYGPPWSHQDRLDMLAFMGRVGLHDYVYAPKDDPYHLARWDEPYPDEELRELEELVRAAGMHGVVFWYAISPGLSIRYSNDEDYGTLWHKLESIAALGVDHFGLFLDDVPPDLTHPEDAAAFANLAEAHIHLTNRLHADLSAEGGRLILTPTTYSSAWGDLAYIDAVGAGVDPDVPIVWTGPDVASPVITADAARAWGARLRRKPLLWDNFPVNDYARWRLFLGPYTGRDAQLATEVAGILSNPMNEAHASMLALSTIAAYTAAPSSYDPARAHREAVTSLLGPATDAAEPLLDLFGDNGWDTNLLEPLFLLSDTVALAPIRQALARAGETVDRLADADDPWVRAFRDEAAPVVDRLGNRLGELTGRADYQVRNDTLFYDVAGDGVRVDDRLTPVIDGSLEEWSEVASVTLTGESSPPAPPSLRFASDETNLYLALTVTGASSDIRAGAALPEGDHVAIIVHPDVVDSIFRPTDPVLLIAPPEEGASSTVLKRTMKFEGFMAKWLRDNRRLLFTEFHLTTFGQALPDSTAYRLESRRTSDGYRVEAAIPHHGADHLRLSVTVAQRQAGRRRVYALQHRVYPINPITYARVELR